MLYPIIRRVRRPLLPVEDRPAVVVPVLPVGATPAKVEESTAVPPVVPNAPVTQPKPEPDIQEEPAAALQPVAPGELAFAVVPLAAEPVAETPNKPTPTRHARKAKTEKE